MKPLKTDRRHSLLWLALIVILAGCTVAKHQRIIRSGLLTSGLVQDAFLREWGVPAATYTAASGPDAMRFGFAFGDGYFTRGKTSLEIWDYTSRGTLLAFNRGRLRLLANAGREDRTVA